MPRAKGWVRVAFAATLAPLSCGRLGYELSNELAGSPSSPSSPGGRDGGSAPTDGGSFTTGGRSASTGAGGAGTGAAGTGGAGASGVGGSTPQGGAAAGGYGGGSAAGADDGGVSTGGSSGSRDAASDGTDGAARASTEAGGTDAGYPYPSCPVTKRWTFGFDSDPTLYDGDADGVNDWVVRGGAPFPSGELGGGVWRSTTPVALDSRPLDDFSTRVLIDVRMQSLTVPTDPHGTVFWINVNEGAPMFSALFVTLALEPSGGQTLTLFGKNGTTETALSTFPGLPETMLDLHLDVDPTAKTVAAWIDGQSRGKYAFPTTGAPNGDAFATLISWGDSSAFDFVDIQRCAP